MNDFNLPDGCSSRDIDRAAGMDAEGCRQCGGAFCANELDENGRCDECIGMLAAEKGEENEAP